MTDQATSTIPSGVQEQAAMSARAELHSDSLFSEMIWLLSGMPLAAMLQAIAEIGVADELVDGPLSVDELAERTGSDPDALYRMLRAVATRGVFTETSHRTFALTQLAQILRSDLPNSLRDAFRMHGQKCMRDTFAEVGHTLRTGTPAFEYANGMPLFQYFAHRPETKDLFESFTGTAARRMQHAALEGYDLTGVRKLVDIGEMHGRLLATILSQYPEMRGVYVDQPFIVPRAEQVLGEAGVADRAELVGANYLESELPADADVYLLPQVLHRIGDEEAITLLKSIRQVMPPTGRVLIIDPVLPEGDVPHLNKVLDATMLLLGPIRDRTEAELNRLFEKAGLRQDSVHGRALPSAVVVATPA
ncbi:methyltransferase [Actinomadura sp. KC06]|uniref:methyltransferase n=1 Tax=Actinomadura sp. KC06 TaxID=2530369 RepID=UPI001A9F4843|nr:methyltransferase [Actinomadura sp. KC06]